MEDLVRQSEDTKTEKAKEAETYTRVFSVYINQLFGSIIEHLGLEYLKNFTGSFEVDKIPINIVKKEKFGGENTYSLNITIQVGDRDIGNLRKVDDIMIKKKNKDLEIRKKKRLDYLTSFYSGVLREIINKIKNDYQDTI